MIRVLGIDHVALNVRDIEKSVAFYEQVLGLKTSEREPSKSGIEVFLECGSSLLGLIQARDFDPVHPFAGEGVGANHFSFRIPAEDFDALIARLEERGVRIDSARKRERSWSLYFHDIDGNKLEATAWPREDGIAEERIGRADYDPITRNWIPR